jgi:hypothetical protein
MRTDTRYTLSGLKRLQVRFIEVNDLAPLAKAAFHQQSRQGFLSLLRSGKVDIPEVRPMLNHRNGVDKAFGLMVDFGDDPGARDFPGVPFALPAEGEFLARKQLIRQPQNPAIPAD